MEEKIKKLLKQNNGIITTNQIEKIGISRVYIRKFIEKGIINKVKKGIYYLSRMQQEKLTCSFS